MKVCVITTYWKGSAGGVAQYVTGLVEELEKSGHIIRVFFREGEDPKNLKIKGNKYIFFIKIFLNLIKLKPDIIHSHGAWYCLLPGVLFKRAFGARLVHTFHTDPKGTTLSSIGRGVLQVLIDNCDCITFVSAYLKKAYEMFWKLKFHNTRITYPGVRPRIVTEKQKMDFIDKFSLQGRWPILLLQAFTAHILKAEGAKLAMLAVKVLKQKYPNITLLLTRKGIYLEELKKFVLEIGIEDSVIFTGDLENPFIALETCDIYVHPSLGDGMPIALLEAMSMGKPIIATNVGGIPEVIECKKNGILVTAKTDELIKSLDYLISNQSLAKWIGQQAIKDSENFNWKNTIKIILKG